MKTIIHKYRLNKILLGIVVILSSCLELEDTNYSTIVAEDFEPTPDDAAAIVGSGYVAWRETMLLWNGIWRSQEVTADQIVMPARPNGWVDDGSYRRLHEHSWNPNDDQVYQGWFRTYSGITKCNEIIYQIETGFIPLEEELYESTLAEIKVLRASYYYLLLDLYGNVPIITDFDVEDGYLPVQNTRQEVYDFIVDEITSNVDNLLEENNGTTYGRFNKWAAYMLLAKVYLNAEVYTGTSRWAECMTACDQVINSGAYALEPNQKNVFVTDNENSIEIIFALAIDEDYTTSWNQFDIHMQTLQPSMQAKYGLQFSPWGGMCAIPQFIDTFDPEDSRLTQNFIYGQQYTPAGEEIMAALGAYAGQPLNLINEVPGVDYSEAIHGYRFGKYEIAPESTNILNNDYVVFRYADILMMKAECLLRTGSADEAALLVTEVRNRSFASNPAKATVSGADLQEGSVYDYGLRNHLETSIEGGDDIQFGRFLDELGWEFNQEGRRRQDMIRFGAFDTKSWLSHSPNGSDRTLYPIPQTVLNDNPNLTQNPGY
ncbi:RagB/SusD family nutrient uptake outer membrane protein [Reichenbachiella ulvae]|uniref:RagB/SusD family nutrient uptake outer membrane protein n=1 Tax=Reichenbachiella ulvae TaxID=2980104 RepID=A0ABT3CUL9_9BACT|nr:RagB/SusD family nutrient uptake outer membrane protein [Reichenbachiella ulvae]MCV9387259.1 RagB/SusD family nutrient uptake outer membrane protein [Reichenbachiella ulvae]